jgi:hypothetical protein
MDVVQDTDGREDGGNFARGWEELAQLRGVLVRHSGGRLFLAEDAPDRPVCECGLGLALCLHESVVPQRPLKKDALTGEPCVVGCEEEACDF